MSTQIILDWDDHHVRMLTLDSVSMGGAVRDAKSAPLEQDDHSVTTIVAALEPLIAPHRGGKASAMVLASGRDLQFRRLPMPPAPGDEMPDMVLLRAASEFPGTDEAGIVDFHPFAHESNQPQPVLVARLSGKAAAMAREVCEKLHLTLEHLTPRGCGLAWLATHEHPALKTGVHVAVGLRAGEMDLVGLDRGAAALVRSVPLTTHAEIDEVARHATRELRRTLAAVSKELAVEKVESIVWFVGDEADGDLARQVGQLMGRTIDTIAVGQPSEFAGLVGAGRAWAELPLAIDFLAPKRRVEKQTPKRALALAGAAAVLLLISFGWLMYDRVASKAAETAQLNAERETIEAEVAKLAPDQAKAEQVAAWLATDVNWLEELDRLAVKLRPKPLDDKEFDAEGDVLLTSFIANKAAGARGSGGAITLSGGVRDGGVIESVETRLRGEGHEVVPKPLYRDLKSSPYVWGFNADVLVTPPTEE